MYDPELKTIIVGEVNEDDVLVGEKTEVEYSATTAVAELLMEAKISVDFISDEKFYRLKVEEISKETYDMK
ncbi:MAG: hypothetical protein ACRCX2_22015 [Paraclostridium sp.]